MRNGHALVRVSASVKMPVQVMRSGCPVAGMLKGASKKMPTALDCDALDLCHGLTEDDRRR
jgi:hypothetical protein